MPPRHPYVREAFSLSTLLTRRRHFFVLAAVVLFLLHCGLYRQFTVDDSFISYRFAHNWARGWGPVYNPGERVEGYTCFAWVAVLALAGRLGLGIELASKVLGIASGALCIFTVAAISRRLLNGRPTYLIAPFALALNPLFAAWACSGMEATLFCCVLSLAVLAIMFDESGRHSIPVSAPCLGLAALIRPEGLLFAGVAFVSIFAGREKRARSLVWAKWLTVLAVVVLPLLVWRANFYGDILPNTFYAKTGRGLERLASGGWSVANFAEYQGLAFVALCVLGLWKRPVILNSIQDPGSTAWRFIRLAVPAFVAYVIWAGGDILHIRFFVHIMGLLAVCLAVGFDRLAAGWRWDEFRKPIAMYCALALAWVGSSVVQDYRALRARDQFGAAYVVSNSRNVRAANIPLGKWLATHARDGSTVAAWDIGGLGYYSNLQIIDLYGLTDRPMARLIHDKASDVQKAAYVISRRPDFIVTYAKPAKPDLQWLATAGYWVRRNYRVHSYWKGGPDGYGLALMVRRDLSSALPAR